MCAVCVKSGLQGWSEVGPTRGMGADSRSDAERCREPLKECRALAKSETSSCRSSHVGIMISDSMDRLEREIYQESVALADGCQKLRR